MTTIYLIRHAEAEGNLYRRIHGWYDALVTDNGFRQIAALEERFREVPVDAVYASGLYRTEATARAVYRAKGLPLHIDPGLREIHMGDWEDKPWGQVRHEEPEALDAFNHSEASWQAPNGESLAQVGRRVADALERIAQENPDRTVAVFSHGTAIRQALAEIRHIGPAGWPELGHSDNTAVSCLVYAAGQFQVVYEMDASHLSDELSTLRRQSWWRKGSITAADVNLWYRPLDWEDKEDQELYLCALAITDPERSLDLLHASRGERERSGWGVSVAMAGDEPVGLLQIDSACFRDEGAGCISMLCIIPERQGQSLGVQLIGQAVHLFRPLGRDRLRLRCPPENERAQRFFARFGFVKTGEEKGLDVLEKYIGYKK